MAGDKGFFVQYKFILPETIKHSHYTYQKLFRAIYGYTQKVCKSNGKSYSYHRKGLLSDTPFIKHGKNCVIIPQDAFPELKNFFQTGKNPTHQWRTKGDWKAVYYLNEKDLTEEQITKAVEDYIDRYYVPTGGAHEKLELELATFLSQQKNAPADPGRKRLLLSEAQRLVSHPWFKQAHKTPKIASFYESYNKLREP